MKFFNILVKYHILINIKSYIKKVFYLFVISIFIIFKSNLLKNIIKNNIKKLI